MTPNERQEIEREVAKRRTFAIISHPDAGKTTLTEKLLLYAGMVRTAGMVKGRKQQKNAASDWMAMEQERGISITASAMQFPYGDSLLNVLDTPGHQDFSEDTYRTLTAADAAVMVFDAAKGVETQTRKLFAVCRLRGVPVFTFVNKMDLPAMDPLDLLSEIEDVLGIATAPRNWPVSSGKQFQGIVDLQSEEMIRFQRTAGGATISESTRTPLAEALADLPEEVRDELELLEGAGTEFTPEKLMNCEVTPVFFGSALTNFGVEPFFDNFVDLAPHPAARPADTEDGEIEVDPVGSPFSAYVFKIQANMNPRHRDNTAFLRVCSGRFEKQAVVDHHRTGKTVRLSRPHSMMAGGRETVDYAYPGDVVGVINPGTFRIGDTVSQGGGWNFKALPAFQPEVFARIRPEDVSKRKSFDKGVEQLAEEGTVQVFERLVQGDRIYGVCGQLQFEVLRFRLEHEYKVKTHLEPMAYKTSAWVDGDPDTFKAPYQCSLVRDREGRFLVLLRSDWDRQVAAKDNPNHTLRDLG